MWSSNQPSQRAASPRHSQLERRLAGAALLSTEGGRCARLPGAWAQSLKINSLLVVFLRA